MKKISFLLLVLIPTLILSLSACSDDGTSSNSNSVEYVPVSSIFVPNASISIVVNGTLNLNNFFNVVPNNATNKLVTFKSDNNSIVSVDEDGIITGHTVDETATITITSVDNSSVSNIIYVAVEQNEVAVTGFTLLVSPSIIRVNGTSQASVIDFEPSSTTQLAVKYTSLNPSIASVDETSGEITGHNIGDTEIVATSVDNPSITSSTKIFVTADLGYNDVNGVWHIYNETGLRTFASVVNGGDILRHAKLTADIVLDNSTPWVPIGNVSGEIGERSYSGVFDGDNYTISRIDINGDNSLGLFKEVGTRGVIKNLNVKDVIISGKLSLGTIAGRNNGTLFNVSTDNVTITLNGFGDDIGGLVGSNAGTIQASYVKNIVIDSQLSTFADIGGLVGQNTFAIVASYADNVSIIGDDGHFGGIVGAQFNEGSILSSYAKKVSFTHNAAIVGGVVGRLSNNIDTTFFIPVDNSLNGVGSDATNTDAVKVTEISDDNITSLNDGLLIFSHQFVRQNNEVVVVEKTTPTTLSGVRLVNGVYNIDNADGLNTIRDYVSLFGFSFINIKLADNISLTGSWTPFAKFNGMFDGNGKSISGLAGAQGLFNKLESYGTIKNVSLISPNINGQSNIGGLANTNRGLIAGISVIGGSIDGDDNIGGIVGENGGTIIASYNTASVTGTSSNPEERSSNAQTVGGIVGRNSSTIIATYNTGDTNGGEIVGENNDRDSVTQLGKVLTSYYIQGVDNVGVASNSDINESVEVDSMQTLNASGAGSIIDQLNNAIIDYEHDNNIGIEVIFQSGASQPELVIE